MGNKLKGRLLHRRAESFQVGDRVTLAEVQLGSSLQAWKDQIVGTIAEVLGTGEEQRYAVDIFAPEQGQDISAAQSERGIASSGARNYPWMAWRMLRREEKARRLQVSEQPRLGRRISCWTQAHHQSLGQGR